MIRRSPGWWLQFLGIAHVGVGAVVYRNSLAAMAKDKLVNSVPDPHSDRAAAFWFVAAAPALWLSGRLLRSAEASGDVKAQRTVGRALVATGLTGAAVIPVSGFWAVAVVGVGALRRKDVREPSGT